MSKTIYILLKVLILAKAHIMSKHPDSDFIQDIQNNNNSSLATDYPDNESKSTYTKAVKFHYGFLNEVNISVTFRWNQSEYTEKIIQGYTVQYWFTENQKKIQICDDKNISATILKCTVPNLIPSTMYYIQVQAHTKVGVDPYIVLINVSTTHKNPRAQLLIVLRSGIDIWDLDSNINITFLKQKNRYYKKKIDVTKIDSMKNSNKSDTSSSSNTCRSVTLYYQPIISSFIAMVIVIFIFYYLHRQCKKSFKRNNQVLSSIITDNLTTLHEIPNNLIVQSNPSYNPALQCDLDKYLPINRHNSVSHQAHAKPRGTPSIEITREQIKLGRFLGSGAFGKVYQGYVKDLERTGIETPVAIKMLPETASLEEKEMFIEETKLMSQFRHKHIVRLLAICFDPESPSIVLELMEIGDLLKYLRDNRKLQPSDPYALRLQDLLAICEDVARGCCYLEDLRFVHRDLACRNCLVSARNRENRVVKISDFGLSRDIYNSNYYRQKKQNMLPVRWMAPESLVMGIFTSQSDVWSFGVIMWEITSLGELPYIGRTNLDMIDHVRAGNRLPMPPNCPPTLYELMLRCWNPENDRPNFKLCLENIIAVRNNTEDTLLNPIDII